MTRVLLVGLQPETVDFTDPALPPGMNAEKIHAGIGVALRAMTDRGWDAESCFILADDTAGPTLAAKLAEGPCGCVVIGAGVRLPPRHLTLLETLINTVRETAPGTPIAFNTRPDDSADAAARWIGAA